MAQQLVIETLLDGRSADKHLVANLLGCGHLGCGPQTWGEHGASYVVLFAVHVEVLHHALFKLLEGGDTVLTLSSILVTFFLALVCADDVAGAAAQVMVVFFTLDHCGSYLREQKWAHVLEDV